jgi:hypothetical protein
MWLSGPMSCRDRVETVSGAPQQPLTAPLCASFAPQSPKWPVAADVSFDEGTLEAAFLARKCGNCGNCGKLFDLVVGKEPFGDSFAPIGPSTRYRRRWPVKHLRPLTLLPSFPHLLNYRPSRHPVVNRRIGREGLVVVVCCLCCGPDLKMLSRSHRPLVRLPDAADVLEQSIDRLSRSRQLQRSPADESRFLFLANQTRQQTSIPGAPAKLYYSIFAESGVPVCTSRWPGHGIHARSYIRSQERWTHGSGSWNTGEGTGH